MAQKRQIPPVERVDDDNARAALSAIKERVEDMDGIRGGNLTTATTVQDLLDVGLIDIDRNGVVTKKAEDEQVEFQDQSLLTLLQDVDLITIADVGAAPVFYSAVYADEQTDLINECKAKINELINNLRSGQFK